MNYIKRLHEYAFTITIQSFTKNINTETNNARSTLSDTCYQQITGKILLHFLD